MHVQLPATRWARAWLRHAEIDASAITEDLPVPRLLDLPLDLDRSVRIPRTVHDLVDDVIIPSLAQHYV